MVQELDTMYIADAETDSSKLFSANIAADDPKEMMAPEKKYVPKAVSCLFFHIDGKDWMPDDFMGDDWWYWMPDDFMGDDWWFYYAVPWHMT